MFAVLNLEIKDVLNIAIGLSAVIIATVALFRQINRKLVVRLARGDTPAKKSLPRERIRNVEAILVTCTNGGIPRIVIREVSLRIEAFFSRTYVSLTNRFEKEELDLSEAQMCATALPLKELRDEGKQVHIFGWVLMRVVVVDSLGRKYRSNIRVVSMKSDVRT